MVTMALSGATGRFGRAILAQIQSDSEIALHVAVAAHAGRSVDGQDGLLTVATWTGVSPVQVILDVSIPEGTRTGLAHAVATGTPFVTGVTGLEEEDLALLADASTTIPVLAAANFSIGVAALLSLLPQIARSLPGYDVSIIDVHHRTKRDAPSGTARLIVDALNEGRATNQQLGPEDVLSVRTGGIPGQHSISFVSMGEEIRVEHRALSRASFAEGALVAARWIVGKPPGLYSMHDVVK